ncbi:MAG TPA: DUF4442 domain-containing protein [Myxococcales bacterium]|nr:DUF4442 domain-containing protein [Myxococcales bacterium]
MDKVKFVFTNPVAWRGMLWTQLPLAGFAGLKIERLDDTGAEVSLPGGWKTRNPFGSTYFAAQAMAAEMSTGAPALWFIDRTGVKVSSLVTGLSAKFTKQARSEARFVFDQGAGMRAAIEKAAGSAEPVTYTARSVGKTADGTQVAEFTVEWSFKRKSPKPRG